MVDVALHFDARQPFFYGLVIRQIGGVGIKVVMLSATETPLIRTPPAGLIGTPTAELEPHLLDMFRIAL